MGQIESKSPEHDTRKPPVRAIVNTSRGLTPISAVVRCPGLFTSMSPIGSRGPKNVS